jgi:hypothetical protein
MSNGNDYIIRKHFNQGNTQDFTCDEFYKLDYKVSLRLMKQQDNSLVPVNIQGKCTDVPIVDG